MRQSIVLIAGRAAAAAAVLLPMSNLRAEVPATVAAPGNALVAIAHAQGAQIYECKPDSLGKLAWSFREPIATLVKDGKTVGRHYVGPKWEMADGSVVTGKVTGRAPGVTATDIPLLRLDVTSQQGNGLLSGVAVIQRINTKGGVAQGPCETAGDLKSVAYTADYAFYGKVR